MGRSEQPTSPPGWRRRRRRPRGGRGELLERGEADLAQPFALHREPLVVPAREEVRLDELLGDGVDGRIRAQLLRRGHEPVDVDRDLGPEAEAVTGPSDHQVGSGLAQPPQRGPEAGAHL
jgi:hypothetical protein